jgi:acetolactate synthase-1/2/3 large subunit
MTVAEYIINYLSEIGVTHIFCVSGGQAMFLIDAAFKHRKIELVQMLHEQSAVVAADAYAQYTGNLGVVLVTSGAGALNCLTGVAASYIDSTPLLIISGQVKTADIKPFGMRSKGVGEVDISTMVEGITKDYCRVYKEDLSHLKETLDGLIRIATTGRKAPVWLEIPLDVQNMEVPA